MFERARNKLSGDALPDATPWDVWLETLRMVKAEALKQREDFAKYPLPPLPDCPSPPETWDALDERAKQWDDHYFDCWEAVQRKEGLTAEPVDGKAPAPLRKVCGIDDLVILT